MTRSTPHGEIGVVKTKAWTVEHTHRNVVTIRMKAESRKWEQWFLLSADRHHDNAHCDWDLEQKHLKQAKERDAIVIDVGDLFCAMQGKWDKRQDRSALREAYQQGPYLDTLVTEAAKFYGPYAAQFAVIGKGNHEGSIYSRHETDLTERLVAVLNDKHGTQIQAGGYGGFVRLLVHRQHANGAKGGYQSKLLHYYHGTGGGGPVTADMIQLDRMRNRVDADIYVFGHTHDQWFRRLSVASVSQAGKPTQREVLAFKCPSYKDAYGDGACGWEIEKGHPPKPIGAWWMRMFLDRDEIGIEAMEAK